MNKYIDDKLLIKIKNSIPLEDFLVFMQIIENISISDLFEIINKVIKLKCVQKRKLNV